jgi:hypothetical protein
MWKPYSHPRVEMHWFAMQCHGFWVVLINSFGKVILPNCWYMAKSLVLPCILIEFTNILTIIWVKNTSVDGSIRGWIMCQFREVTLWLVRNMLIIRNSLRVTESLPKSITLFREYTGTMPSTWHCIANQCNSTQECGVVYRVFALLFLKLCMCIQCCKIFPLLYIVLCCDDLVCCTVLPSVAFTLYCCCYRSTLALLACRSGYDAEIYTIIVHANEL